MKFDPRQALAYARVLARPRLVGAGADEAVASEIAKRLESFGYHVERQPFEFVSGVNLAVRLEVLAGQLLILTTFWAWGQGPWWAVVCALLILALLSAIERLNRWAEAASLALEKSPASFWRVGLRRYRAVNLAARLPDDSDQTARPHLYLVAHSDSKSQFVPILVRVALFMIVSLGAAAMSGLTLVRAAIPGVTPAAALCGLAALLAGIPLLLLDTGNLSPGAIDNAAGVGLALHLAECLSQDQGWRDKLHLTVLITSAEEFALMGAAAYVHAHDAELRRQTREGGVSVVNLDSIGMAGKLYCAGGPGRLLSLVRQACDELGIPLGRFRLLGVLFDHLPFARRGFDALSLMTIGRAVWAIHTARDTVDKLDVEGFRQGGEVVLSVAQGLMDLKPVSPTSSGS
jgi:hypothetical protein